MHIDLLLYNVRFFIKRSPIIYLLKEQFCQNILGRQKHKLCGKGVDLCVEGYPSSGNSFAKNLLKELNSHITISSHFHSIANIKLAIKYGIPAIILIRSPEEAISSVIVRNNYPELLAVLEYREFYQQVLDISRTHKLTIISFDDLSNQTAQSLHTISEATRIQFSYGNLEELENIKRHTLENMREWFRIHGRSEINTGLPTTQKENLKRIVKERLQKSPYWDTVTCIYEQILVRIETHRDHQPLAPNFNQGG